MRRIVTVFAVLSVFVVAPGAAQNTQSSSVLSGVVTDRETGGRLGGAVIRVEPGGRSVVTSADGRYHIGSLAAGRYDVNVALLGFEAATATIVIEGDVAHEDFALVAEAVELAPLLVTGERIVRDQQDAQTSVALLTDERLTESGVRDWRDALRLAANVQPSVYGGLVIRGLDSDGVGSLAGAPLATIYVDGVPQSDQSMRGGVRGLWDVEQVEILRGPQSTTSGRNSLAGAIHIRGKRPSPTWIAGARIGAGNLTAREVAGVVSGPIVEDQLAVRISAQYREEGSGTEWPNLQVTGRDEAFTSYNEQVRAAVLFTPRAVPGLAATLAYTRAIDRPIYDNYVRSSDPWSNRATLETYASVTETALHNVALETTYDITDSWRVTSISGVLDDHADWRYLVTPGTTPGSTSEGPTKELNLSQELRLNFSSGDSRVRAALGVFYTDAHREAAIVRHLDVTESVGAQFPVIAHGFTYDTVDTRNAAIFGELELPVGQRLRLVLGARYDHESQDAFTKYDITLDPPVMEVPSEETRLAPEFNAFLPKAGLVYDLRTERGREASLGLTFQQGYRAGGQIRDVSTGEAVAFDPELTDNFELAVRTMWADGRLTVNANAFYTRWRDQQVNVPIPGISGYYTVDNAGDSRLYGAELDVRARPAPALDVFGSLGLIRTKFIDYVSSGQDYSGNEFPRASDVTAQLGAEWGLPEGVFLGGDVSLRSDFYSQPDNSTGTHVEARTLFGARAGYRWSRASVTAYVDNLFDVDYADYHYTDEDDEYYGVGLPRTARIIIETFPFGR